MPSHIAPRARLGSMLLADAPNPTRDQSGKHPQVRRAAHEHHSDDRNDKRSRYRWRHSDATRSGNWCRPGIIELYGTFVNDWGDCNRPGASQPLARASPSARFGPDTRSQRKKQSRYVMGKDLDSGASVDQRCVRHESALGRPLIQGGHFGGTVLLPSGMNHEISHGRSVYRFQHPIQPNYRSVRMSSNPDPLPSCCAPGAPPPTR